MKEFFTRSQINEGVRVGLSLPDGTPTQHWIEVKPTLSDFFKSNIIELGLSKSLTIEQSIACCVSDWSFDEERSIENVAAFLKEAPQIARELDSVASDLQVFFREKKRRLSSSLNRNSRELEESDQDPSKNT